MPADGDAAKDRAVGPERGALPDQGLLIELGADLGILAAGILDVGEDGRRAAEDVILEGHALVDRNVVLDLDEVPDDDVVGDIDVLAQHAAPADPGAALDMAEVPDLRPLADPDVLVDERAFVDEIGRFRHSRPPS